MQLEKNSWFNIPKDDFIKVRNVRKIRDGGLLVETSDKEGAVKIKGNVKLKESRLSAITPKMANPKIMIYNVRNLGFEDICEGLWKQNPKNRVDIEAM